MRLIVYGKQIRIEADRTELIKLAAEMLSSAATTECDFDPRKSCSPVSFTFDEVDVRTPQDTSRLARLEAFCFVRVREESP